MRQFFAAGAVAATIGMIAGGAQASGVQHEVSSDVTAPVSVNVIETSVDEATWYGYEEVETWSSNTGLEQVDKLVLAYLRSSLTGKTSLVGIFDSTEGSTGGAASASFSGLQPGGDFIVTDDADGINDSYSVSGTTAEASWVWNSGKTDGFVFGDIGTIFDVDMDLSGVTGIDNYVFASATTGGGVEFFDLGDDPTSFNFRSFVEGPGDGSVIPEPATWAMMLAGFALAGLRLQRRRAA